MRTQHLSAYVTTALLAVLTASVTGLTWDTEPPVELLTDAEYELCGLHKLSDQERLHLFGFLMAQPQQSFLARTAEAFMVEEGYLPTVISGPLPAGENDHRPALLAYRDGKAYLLDVPIGHHLQPGTYWSDGFGTAWGVVMPDGDEDTYWVREELQ